MGADTGIDQRSLSNKTTGKVFILHVFLNMYITYIAIYYALSFISYSYSNTLNSLYIFPPLNLLLLCIIWYVSLLLYYVLILYSLYSPHYIFLLSYISIYTLPHTFTSPHTSTSSHIHFYTYIHLPTYLPPHTHRTYLVSECGNEAVNGLYESNINPESLNINSPNTGDFINTSDIMNMIDISKLYYTKQPSSPEEPVLTILRCNMKTKVKYWYISVVDKEKPGEFVFMFCMIFLSWLLWCLIYTYLGNW